MLVAGVVHGWIVVLVTQSPGAAVHGYASPGGRSLPHAVQEARDGLRK